MKLFFDLDGTLLDVAPRHYRVYQEIVNELGGQPLAQPEYWQAKRQKAKWPELLTRSRLQPSHEPEFLKRFIAKIESVEYLRIDALFPAALDVVTELSQRAECYLVSLRRNHQNILQQLSWLGLLPKFQDVLTGHSESDGHDVKTALISSVLGNDMGVIIGDTEADIVTGQNLGLRTIGVTSGIRDKSFLAALKPDHLVAGIGDVPGVLRG